MQKRNVRFVPDRRNKAAYPMGSLADLDELAERLTWESIHDFFFHINEITWALSRSRISFALGSIALFTAWWFLLYLTFGRLPALTLGASIALYVVAAGALYLVLSSVRFLMTPAP